MHSEIVGIHYFSNVYQLFQIVKLTNSSSTKIHARWHIRTIEKTWPRSGSPLVSITTRFRLYPRDTSHKGGHITTALLRSATAISAASAIGIVSDYDYCCVDVARFK